MDFGKVEKNVLDKIDFKLPADTAFTKETLKRFGKISGPKVYIGAPVWGCKEWIGHIYPRSAKQANFLDHYVNHFNSIELNATHYKIYPEADIAKWAAKAKGKDFLFCPKVPQSISHNSNLISPAANTGTVEFLKNIRAFKENLGPVFFQVSDQFAPAARQNLYTYLRGLPRDLQFFLELRNAQWFKDAAVLDEWTNVLRELNIGAVITDVSGRRDVLHMELPVARTLIRFVGNDLHTTDYSRIDAWVLRIKNWLEDGLQEIFFFMHQPGDKAGPKLCKYLIEQLNEHCGTHLKPIIIVPDIVENTLF